MSQSCFSHKKKKPHIKPSANINKGLRVGPSLAWAFRKEPRSTDLTLAWEQTRAFTSHTWLSDIKSPCACQNTTVPWLCMAIPGNLPANRHAKALHGHTQQSAKSPCHGATGSLTGANPVDRHTHAHTRPLMLVGALPTATVPDSGINNGCTKPLAIKKKKKKKKKKLCDVWAMECHRKSKIKLKFWRQCSAWWEKWKFVSKKKKKIRTKTKKY